MNTGGNRSARELAAAAHDVKVPVAVIRAHCARLRSSAAASGHLEDLALIERSVAAISDRLETLLDQAAQAEKPAVVVPVDLRDLAASVAEELRPLAEDRGLRLETDAPRPAPAVGDPERLRSAILNLAHNAIRHSPDGGAVRIAIRLGIGRVTVAVSDQGPGVPRGERERVLRPYERGAGSADDGGSGLGLAIAAEAAEAHGGTVRIDEAPGGGALVLLSVRGGRAPRRAPRRAAGQSRGALTPHTR